jgi:hypothetical protein
MYDATAPIPTPRTPIASVARRQRPTEQRTDAERLKEFGCHIQSENRFAVASVRDECFSNECARQGREGPAPFVPGQVCAVRHPYLRLGRTFGLSAERDDEPIGVRKIQRPE